MDFFTNSTPTTINILYSKNNGEWITWDFTEISLSTGDTLKLKGNNPDGFSNPNNGYLNTFNNSTGKVDVSGNIMSLLYTDDFQNKTEIPCEGCFTMLFGNEMAPVDFLINAKNLVLPATTLTDSCYAGMFAGCISLISVPELPATTLAENCYTGMFLACVLLTSAPELPATTLAERCYNNMFIGCISLTSAPELPATTLADYCYESMFYGCASLTTAPELPATTLAKYCYSAMFYSCTSLTTAPELPATTLADYCYESMFYNCTSLTSAPELPATTLAERCYSEMFNDCTLLNYIKMLATDISADYCLNDWVSNVSSTGAFVKSAGVEIPTGDSGIPSGWTVQEV